MIHRSQRNVALCLVALSLVDLCLAADGTMKVGAKRKPADAWREYDTRTVESLDGYQPKTVPVNVYGSRTPATEAATGFFYTKQVGERWWLIDPEGCRHFNVAVVSVSIGRGPAQQEAFAKAYGSPETWADETAKTLVGYGFNGTGAWSDDTALRGAATRLNYCVNWSFMDSFAAQRTTQTSGHRKYPQDVVFAFDPEWPAFCERRAAERIAPFRDDPHLLGHFYDNEMPLKPKMIYRYLKLPTTDYGYQAARAFLDERHGAEATAKDLTEADWRAFDEIAMEKYVGTVSRAIRAVDPNHLLLGPRLYSDNAAYAVVGKYVGAFAYNLYGQWSPRRKATELAKAVGKPLIVTEYYTKGMDVPGLTNKTGAGWCVPTQRDRGLFYQNYGLDLLESGICVGWQWFKYQDNDPLNLKTDPSNRDSNKGIVGNDFQPYQPLVDEMKALNTQVYGLIDFFDSRR